MDIFGRVDFVQEVEEKELRKFNSHKTTKSDRRDLITHRKIDDFLIAKDLGITVAELNQSRMYQ